MCDFTQSNRAKFQMERHVPFRSYALILVQTFVRSATSVKLGSQPTSDHFTQTMTGI